MDRHIWEGWYVSDFIEALEPHFDRIMDGDSWMRPIKTKSELKQWVKDNQPYYKKHIPEVYNYFKNKMYEIQTRNSL
jgi:hypothetical protein